MAENLFFYLQGVCYLSKRSAGRHRSSTLPSTSTPITNSYLLFFWWVPPIFAEANLSDRITDKNSFSSLEMTNGRQFFFSFFTYPLGMSSCPIRQQMALTGIGRCSGCGWHDQFHSFASQTKPTETNKQNRTC